MYLLDLISQAMHGEKRALAIALLHDPLASDVRTMQRWIAADVCGLFRNVQTQCHAELQPDAKSWLFRTRMGAMGVCAIVRAPDGSAFSSDELSQHIVSQACGQIREDLWKKTGRSFDDLPVDCRTALVLLYMFAELIFWMLLEIIEYIDGRFVLTKNEALIDGCRLYFFGHELARQSVISDTLAQLTLIAHARKWHGSVENMLRRDRHSIDPFVDSTLDKYFSCHPHFMAPMRERGGERFRDFTSRARLICYLSLRFLEEHTNEEDLAKRSVWGGFFPTRLTADELYRVGFPSDDIRYVLSTSECAAPGEALLKREADGSLSMGDLNLKYALVAYSKWFFESNTPYGDWFEKDYVVRYLRTRLDSSRYAILEGFKSGSNEAIRYDVDVSIVDRSLDAIYFIQVKHLGTTLRPYLRDEIREFSERGRIGEAVAQLSQLKDSFNSSRPLMDRIRNTFKKEGFSVKHIDAEYLRRRAGTIVVHSVENFDFGVKNGVALYEWNTFRNLLKETTTRHENGIWSALHTKLGGPRLDEPAQVAAAYLRWYDSLPRPAGYPSFSETLKAKEELRCEVLSSRRWELFGRWKLTRPHLHLEFPVI
jgi:hypothetical protein